MTDADNPSFKDEYCPGPGGLAYNEAKARAEFGDAFIDRLKGEQAEFRGDWWQLAKLVKNLEDDEARPDIKPEERLADWNGWRIGESAQAYLGRPSENIHLEHADLFAAHLEHANLHGAHLEHANLFLARLIHARLHAAHLEHAKLNAAHLEHANLRGAHLEHAMLGAAHLEHVDLQGAHLEHASLNSAYLEHGNLTSAHLEGAQLDQAVLSEANLRSARGLFFCDNRVRDIDIEGDAIDPWSVLRRKYTGPWFFVHLLLLIVFFTPYVARTFSLTVQSRGQEWAFAQFARLESALGDAHSVAGREACEKAVDTVFRDWIQRAEGAIAESPLPEDARRELMTRLEGAGRSGDAFCDAVPDLRIALRSLREDYEITHPRRRAIWMLLGEKSGWHWLLPAIVIVYNVIRGYLTMRVSMLRDAEERSQRTPTLEEYYGICHPLRTVTRKKNATAGDGDADRDGEKVRTNKSGWVHAAVAALFVTPGWARRDPWSAARTSHQLLRPLRYLLTWFSEIPLRFGLYRLHQIARVLLWFAITAVAWNSYVWARDTMIRVPVEAKASTDAA